MREVVAGRERPFDCAQGGQEKRGGLRCCVPLRFTAEEYITSVGLTHMINKRSGPDRTWMVVGEGPSECRMIT